MGSRRLSRFLCGVVVDNSRTLRTAPASTYSSLATVDRRHQSPVQRLDAAIERQTRRHMVHVSPFRDVEIPEIDIYTHIFESTDTFADRTCAVDFSTGVKWTHGQMRENSARLGSALVKRGLRAGDAVAVFSPNTIEYLATILATVGVGAALTTVNSAFKAAELRRQMIATHPKFILTTMELYSITTEALADPSLKDVVVIVSDGVVDGALSFADLLQDSGDAFPDEAARRALIDPPTTTAIMPFSSGTTALPKGVELTHRNMVANLSQACSTEEIFGDTSDASRERVLGLLPIWHIYQLFNSLVQIRLGKMLLLLKKFEPPTFLESISRYKLDFLPLVPPLLLFLNKDPMVDEYDMSSVRDIICAAAPLTKELHAEVMKKFSTDRVRQAWGMSETSPLGTCSPTSRPRPGSCGVPVPNTMIKILDAGNERSPLRAGETGEIVIKGPQVMKGYLNNPTETRAVFTHDGWMHTGDIGYIDGEGYLYIVDRLKELIKYKGHQVAPAELEGVLVMHPAVADAAVIGVPDEEAGEVPRAFVVLKPGVSASEDEVRRFVDNLVNPMSKIRGGVVFVDGIPKTTSGKILRKDVRMIFGDAKRSVI